MAALLHLTEGARSNLVQDVGELQNAGRRLTPPDMQETADGDCLYVVGWIDLLLQREEHLYNAIRDRWGGMRHVPGRVFDHIVPLRRMLVRYIDVWQGSTGHSVEGKQLLFAIIRPVLSNVEDVINLAFELLPHVQGPV